MNQESSTLSGIFKIALVWLGNFLAGLLAKSISEWTVLLQVILLIATIIFTAAQTYFLIRNNLRERYRKRLETDFGPLGK